MAIITPKNCIMTIICLLCINLCLLAQKTIYKVPLNKQVELSSQIVEGEVISKTSFWDATYSIIYTAYTVQVNKVFKGNPSEEIQIIVEGGVVDLNAQVVSHSLQLKNGELGMFMLSNHNYDISTTINSRPSYKSVSAIQGFYKYDLNNDKVANVFSYTNGITNNFYNMIKSHTKRNYIEVRALNLESNKSKTSTKSANATSSVSSFSATENSAGTNSILTINGTGFGSTQGTVGFSNADYGGVLHTETLENQIVSWTDTQIEVEIPAHAGTGTIEINTITNGTVTTSNNLIIDFAHINIETNIGQGEQAYQTQHVDMNTLGGYTLTMNSSFSNNTDALDAFIRAMENWTCDSGMSWDIDGVSTTNINSAINDDINVITFDSNLSSGILGRCTSYYQGCMQDGEVKWFVEELDIVFNPNNTWNYSTNAPLSGEVDFESVALHELGHGHQLGHVVDNNEVMHYTLSSGVTKRDISNEDLAGATMIQDRSINNSVCGVGTSSNISCPSQGPLSNNEFELQKTIEMYPNPTNGSFYIKNNSQINIKSIQIYDILGKTVFIKSNLDMPRERIDMTNQRQGVYIVKFDTDYGSVSKKLIIR